MPSLRLRSDLLCRWLRARAPARSRPPALMRGGMPAADDAELDVEVLRIALFREGWQCLAEVRARVAPTIPGHGAGKLERSAALPAIFSAGARAALLGACVTWLYVDLRPGELYGLPAGAAEGACQPAPGRRRTRTRASCPTPAASRPRRAPGACGPTAWAASGRCST